MSEMALEVRARAHAALGDPSRLSIIDMLAISDLASGELGAALGIPTNLIAHHLHVLEEAGMILRRRSEGDGRRTYVSRTTACNDLLGAGRLSRPRRVAFICSQNSARSQLAEFRWRAISDIPVVSGGTHPASRVHPRAVAVGRRHGLDLGSAQPKLAANVLRGDELVIAVCDRAYEGLAGRPLHWSIRDPDRDPDRDFAESGDAFDRAYDDITARITRLVTSIQGETP